MMEQQVRLKRDLPPERDVLTRPTPRCWWEGADPIRLTLTANAGILVTYRGEKLLVDGLHHSHGHDFSPVPRELLDRIERGEGIYAGIGWLLYTHLHIDHFSGVETIRFLEHNSIQKLFLPAGNDGPGLDAGIAPLREWLMAHATPVQELRLFEGRPVCYPLCPGIRLTAIRSLHAAAEYESVEHECFLLELGERTLFFLGDSDYDKDYFASVLAGRKIDAAVVNPLFISKQEGRAVLLEGVRPKRVIVNHIPFAQDDCLRMRKLVSHRLGRYVSELPPTAVLWDEEDSVVL